MELTPEQKQAAEQEKTTKEAAKQAEKQRKALEKQQKSAAKKQGQDEDEEQDEEEVETQKIKFLRTHLNYAYWPGDHAKLSAEHVEFLTTGGFAELVTPTED